MFIVNQKRNRVFNMDQFQQICVHDNNIQCKWGSEVCVMATYKDAERAGQVFDSLLSNFQNPRELMYIPEE